MSRFQYSCETVLWTSAATSGFPCSFKACSTIRIALIEWVGTVVNVSKGGCLVETDSHVFSGMYVSLRLDVPGETLPILIERAAVRWNRGREVGVGFITVVPPHQERFDQLLKRLKQEFRG